MSGKSSLVLCSNRNLPNILLTSLIPNTPMELLLGRSPPLFKRLSLGFCLRANALVVSYLEDQIAPPLTYSTAPYHICL